MNPKNTYDDGNIPETDLPQNAGITHAQNSYNGGQEERSDDRPADPKQPRLTWVTPPVLLSDNIDSQPDIRDQA